MNPIAFTGQVPHHLMSPAALRAEEEQARQDAISSQRLDHHVAVLSGELSSIRIGAITLAMRRLASAVANGEDLEPTKASAAEIVSLVGRGLDHLVAACADETSEHHWSNWGGDDFIQMGTVGDHSTKLGLTEKAAQLGVRLLQAGVARHLHSIHSAVWAHIAEVHKSDPAAADRYELEVIRATPSYDARRRGPWLPASSAPNVLANTESFARQALTLMTDRQAQVFADSCELDWLTPAMAKRSMFSSMSEERARRFTSASKEQVLEMLAYVLERSHHGYSYAGIAVLPSVPAWKQIEQDSEALRPFFQASPYRLEGDTLSWNLNRLNNLRQLAEALPDKEASSLMDDVLVAGVRELSSAKNPKAGREMAESFLWLATYMANDGGNRAPRVRELLLGADLLNNPNVCPNGLAALRDGRAGDCEDYVRRELRRFASSAEVVTAYRAAFIEAGLIGIGAVRYVDQRKDIIGPALERKPERLAEVTDLERFIDLARKFGLPIQVPDTVREEVRTQVAMSAAIIQAKSVDALAAVDPTAPTPKAPGRRPRARA